MLEIERTFLLGGLPKRAKKLRKDAILQGYLSTNKEPLRIRKKGARFEMTKKLTLKKGDESAKEEINIPLTKKEFKKLWRLVVKYLEKTRHYHPLKGGLIAEIDVYGGKLKGLMVVEVEFKSVRQMNAFIPPKWFGRDVTQESWSSNSQLAGRSFKDIKKYLQ
jgi:CYTH domain-containing protein